MCLSFSVFGNNESIIGEEAPVVADITFCVDPSCFPGGAATVELAGPFNGWNPSANPMSDPDGDGIYCTTVNLADGQNEYKFVVNGVFEEFPHNGTACTMDFGVFTNRVIDVVNGVNQTVTFGYNSCDATCAPPPTSADVTFCVDMSCLPTVTNPSVFGAFNGWNPTANPLAPMGGGIYCTTVANMPPNNQQFKFFTDEQADENFQTDLDCTVNDGGFINRTVFVAGAPQTVTFGFNSCDATCNVPPAPADVTFCVDVNCIPNVADVFLTGPFVGWSPNALPMTDPDGDGIYCITHNVPGGQVEYKFVVNGIFEEFAPGGSCTMDFGGFVNRVIQVNGLPQMASFGYNSCDPNCVPLPSPLDFPINFDDPFQDYDLVDFGGAMSTIADNPIGGPDQVLCIKKLPGAQTWGGSVVGDIGLSGPVPFTATNQIILMDVWSPMAGMPVLLKVENNPNPGISTEVLVNTTVGMTWETLVFDFGAAGVPPLDLTQVYDVVVIFPNFGVAGEVENFYFDNIRLDDEAPIVVCPNDLTVNLGGGECGTFGNWTAPTVTDNSGAILTAVQTSPPAGTFFERGTTTAVTFEATDGSGNVGSCTFNITVVEFANPVSSISCNNGVNVS